MPMRLLSRYLRWRRRHVQHLAITDKGCALSRDGEDPVVIGWDDIVTVHAFKRDLLTVDMVCLAIAAQDGSAIEVNEGMPGFADLVGRIDAMPGTLPAWQLDVMFPAFAPNLTRIYPAAEPA